MLKILLNSSTNQVEMQKQKLNILPTKLMPSPPMVADALPHLEEGSEDRNEMSVPFVLNEGGRRARGEWLLFKFKVLLVHSSSDIVTEGYFWQTVSNHPLVGRSQ